ncbi:hypothetical protein CBFG_00647 [Clostridiales bacterium 1_7_47FAA]|nr:hypothetical protein CBFG_00647 [Clostridiales bacterium 1_7_47FAA]
MFQSTLGILSKCGCILRRCVVDLMAVGIPITLRPPLPLSLFLAIHPTTLEDGRILADIC